MSDGLLDERVVEMRFDNADFERNVNQSIKTIDKLKESLDFENAGESFESISNAAAKCDVSPLEESLEGISVKFNMLEMVAANVLGNITSKIVDAGAKLAKSLTVDQLTAGWQKYDQKTAAVQTIMSATGASIDVINQKLEKLIWFADETSYDFVDMVNNIGKFTSAGVDLDTAVDSMMGISNWAAASGAGIQQASRAMYNLSQAIGMGYVGLTDWRSIELANMATKEFKETVIATAIDMGTLQQAADGTVKTLSGKFEVTAENMRNSLKEQWFSTDVLNSALAAYNEFANAVHDRQEQWAEEHDGAYLTVSRTIKLLEEEGYAMDTLGAKAFMRAQEATKFSEAVAATADAVSSGWMRTFEIIFGNYEQAKKLWTDLANDMYDVFASGNERRNEKLSDVMHSNYQKMLDEMPDGNEMNERLYDKLLVMARNRLGVDEADALFAQYESIEELLKDNAAAIQGSSLERAMSQVSEDFAREAKTAANLSKQLKSGSLTLKQAVIRLATNQYGAELEAQRKAVEALGFDYESLKELADQWNAGLEIPWDLYQAQLVEALDDQEKTYKTFVEKIGDLFNDDNFSFKGLTEFGGRDKLIAAAQSLIDTFKNVYLTVVEVKNGISDLFGSGSFLSNIINGFYTLTSYLNYTDDEFAAVQERIQKFFNGGLQKKWNTFWKGYDKFVTKSTMKNGFEVFYDDYEHVPGLLDNIFSIYKDHLANLPVNVAQTIEKIRTSVFEFFNSIPQKFNEIKTKILGEKHVTKTLTLFSEKGVETEVTYVGGLLNDLKEKIRGLGDGLGGKILDGLLNTIKKIADFLFGYKNENGTQIEGAFVKIYDKATALWQKLKDIGKVISDIFHKFADWLGFYETGIFNPDTKEIESKWLRTYGVIDKVKQVIVDTFTTISNWLGFDFGGEEHGINIILGIFNGIIEGIKNVGDWIKKHIFDPFVEGFKSVFGIHSPAKEMEPLGEKIFLGILEGIKNVAKSIGSWIKVHIFIPIKNALTSSIKEFLDNTAVGSYIEKVKEKFQSLKQLIEKFAGSPAIKSVKSFLLGEKDSEGKVIKNNIFGKIGTAIGILQEKIGSLRSTFLTFFFGPVNEEGKRTENLFKRLPGYFEKAKNEIKTFFLGDKSKGVENFFVRIRNGFDSIIKDAGYTSLHDFIFGNSKLGLDNIFIRTLDAAKSKIKELSKTDFGKTLSRSLEIVKKKFEELKAAHPWLQSLCDLIDKGISKIREKLGGTGKGLLGIIESLSGIFGKVWNKIVAIKERLFKKDQKGIFESLWEFITGPAKFLQGINKTARIIVEALAGLAVVLLASSIKFGGLEITSPFANFAGTVKDFAISVAIIAGVLVGVPALVSKLGIEQHALSNTAVALAGIMAILVGCAKILEGEDHKLSLSDIIKVQVNTIPTLKALSTIILEIAAIAAVFALMAKFIGPEKVWTGVGAITVLLLAIGACLALFHLPEIIHGASKDLKTRAGELFGVAAILWMLGNFLIKFAISIGAIAVIAQSIEKDKNVIITFVGLLATVIGSVITILLLLKSFDGKSIDIKVVASLGILLLIIRSLGSVISTLANIAKKKGGLGAIVTAAASISVILIGLTHLIKRLSSTDGVDISAIITLGILRYVITGIGDVLEQVALVTKKAGAGNMWSAVGSLAVMLIALVGSIAVLNQIDVSLDILATIGSLALLLGGLGGILILLFKLQNSLGVKVDPEKTLSLLASIGEMVLAIIALGFIFGLLGQVAEGLNSGFGALAGMVAKTVGIVALVMVLVGVIGGIAKAIDSKLGENSTLDAINYFGELLESVFNALGKAVGAVIGGLGEGLTDSLPKISQNISDFITKLDPFIEKVGNLEEKHLTGAGVLTAILLAIAADTVIANITALAAMFTGGVSAFTIGSNMSNLIEKLQPFLTAVVKLDESHVKGAGYFTRLLIKVGIQTFIAALTSIAGMFNTASPYTIGTNMSNLIEKLGPFINAVKDINETHVKGAGYFTSLLIAVGKQLLISSVNNLISLFGGSKNFSQMFAKLNDEVVPGIKKFSNGLSGLTLDKVEKASKVLPAIFDMLTDDHYRTGGLAGIWDWITKGEVDYVEMFSSLNEKILPGLRDFASGVNALDDSGKEMDYSHVGEAAKAIKAVMDIMAVSTKGMISDEDGSNGIFGWFSKPSSAEQLKNSFETITSVAVPAIFALQNALKTVSEDGEEIDPNYIQQVIGSFAALLQAITDFRDVGLSEEEVGQIGSYIVTGLVNALDEGALDVKLAAQRLGKNIVDGLTLTLEVHSPSKVAYEIGQFVAAGLTDGLRAGEGMTWSMARAFGKGTINALEEGLGNFDSVSQHAINMVTQDLLDENRFDMPDFSFINRFGNEDIDFDAMEKFLNQNFHGVFDDTAIKNFVGSYRQAMHEVKQTINDSDYNSLMVDIAEGDYGLGHDAIIDSLTKELGTVEAANQAWEDYTDVLAGNLKINKDLLKQRKQNPPMTEEQWMAMFAWDEEGFEKANKGEFLKLAEQNGTTWQQEAAKQGYDPRHIQDRFNKTWQNSEEYQELYIKQRAENEILEEQTRLVDNVIESTAKEQKTVSETATAVEELNESFEDSRNGRNYFVDESEGLVEEAEAEQKVLKNTKKAVEDLSEAHDAIRNGEEIFIDEAEGILIEYEGMVRGREALQDFRDAVAETTNTVETNNEVIVEEAKELGNVADNAKSAADATEELNDKVSSSDKTVLNYLENLDTGSKSFVKNIGGQFANQLKNIEELPETLQFDLGKAIGDKIGGDSVVGKALKGILGDKFTIDVPVKPLMEKMDISTVEELQNALSVDNLAKNLSTGAFADLFGSVNLFGEGSNFLDVLLTALTSSDGSGIQAIVEGLLTGSGDALKNVEGLEDALNNVNDTEVKINADTSSVENAISMADQLKQKYTLSDVETSIAKQAAANLQNGVALTQKQADALQKIWNGTMIGMYDSGDKRINQLMQLFDLDWDTLASFSDGFGKLDLSKATSSAQEYADTVLQMEKYSTADLFKDIQEGKWGVGADRLKALEKAGYDAEKVQEKFLAWHGGDSALADLPDDYLKISEAEKEANKQAEKMNAVLNQTPEGAFRSVADFLDGVSKAIENKDTASEFKTLITDIVDSMNGLTLSNGSEFEKISGFLTAIRTSAKESSTIAQDFKSFVDGIKDSLLKLGEIDIKNPEGMEKVKDFLNNIKIENKETLESVSSFIGNIVEFATGANAGGDYSTKLVEAIDALMASINGIELNEKATTPVVEFLDELTKAAGLLSSGDTGVVQTFIDNIYTALENSKDKAGSAADVIANVIVDTLSGYYDDLMKIGDNFVWWLARGILKAKKHVESAGESIAGALMNSIKDQGVSKAMQQGQDFVSNFISGLNSPEAQGALQTALDNLFNPKVEEEYDVDDVLAEKLAGKSISKEETAPTETEVSAGTQYGQQFIQDMSTAISQGSTSVGESLSTLGESLSTSVTIDTAGITQQASEFVANLAAGLASGLEDNRTILETAMSELNSLISSGVPDGYGLGYSYMEGIYNGLLAGAADFNLGSFLPEGLAKGIQQGLPAAESAGQSIAETVNTSFEHGEGINSPSKVFMKYGEYLLQGLAIGIEDNSYLAKESTGNMANMMSAMFSDAVANISELANDEMNLDPVIRPVIDMSDVYESAGKIDAALSTDKAVSISAVEKAKADAMNTQNASSEQTPGSQTFYQYNYSPKALSRLEIYRQTRNQFAMIKGVNQVA